MSRRPFDYINGLPVNLKNDEHVKEVIARNNKLKYFLASSQELFELDPNIKISVTVDCPSCGGEMSQDVSIHVDDSEIIEDHITHIKCEICKAAFNKTFRNGSQYKLRIPKTNLIKKK